MELMIRHVLLMLLRSFVSIFCGLTNFRTTFTFVSPLFFSFADVLFMFLIILSPVRTQKIILYLVLKAVVCVTI